MAEIGQQFSPLHALYANLQTHKTVLVLIYLDFFLSGSDKILCLLSIKIAIGSSLLKNLTFRVFI